MRTYWVYILASRPYGTLYIGVTNNLLGRVERHRDGDGSAFTSQYGVGLARPFRGACLRSTTPFSARNR